MAPKPDYTLSKGKKEFTENLINTGSVTKKYESIITGIWM